MRRSRQVFLHFLSATPGDPEGSRCRGVCQCDLHIVCWVHGEWRRWRLNLIYSGIHRNKLDKCSVKVFD